MNTKILIGASISSRTDASQSVEEIFATAKFPETFSIENHSSTRLVLPELKALDIAPFATEEAFFRDLGEMKRVVSSIAQISRLNSYQLLATISTIGQQSESSEDESAALDQENKTSDDELKQDDQTNPPVNNVPVLATLVQELEGGVLVLIANDIQFQVKKNQWREDGSLTAGGLAAYEAAANLLDK